MANNTDKPEDYDAITTRNALTSPLLRLPAELRNNIYVYVSLEGNYCLPIAQSPYPHNKNIIKCDRDPPAQWLGLLLTCRQTHREAGLLPCTVNSFSASVGSRNFEDFNVWFAKLKTSNKPIETVRLQVDMHGNYHYAPEKDKPSNLAVLLPSVKKVVVYCVESRTRVSLDLQSMFFALMPVGNRARAVEEAVRKWLRAEEEGLEVEFVRVERKKKIQLSRGEVWMSRLPFVESDKDPPHVV